MHVYFIFLNTRVLGDTVGKGKSFTIAFFGYSQNYLA